MISKKITIKGLVHDVGYRLFLLNYAESMFLEQFDARNVLINGKPCLIVLVKGKEEKINNFVDFAKSNYPPESMVESVDVEDYYEEVRSIDSFRQSFMVSQLSKIAQVGVGMIKKQSRTIEVLESVKQDTSKMLEKQDKMLEKQDETIKVIKEESEKTREVIIMESRKTRSVLKEKIDVEIESIKNEIIYIKTTLSKLKEKVGLD
ncbi:MAG: acylphosphatase [Methanosarcinales archaeon]